MNYPSLVLHISAAGTFQPTPNRKSPRPSLSEAQWSENLTLSDQLLAFIGEHCCYVPGGLIRFKDFRLKFSEWLTTQGRLTWSAQQLANVLVGCGYIYGVYTGNQRYIGNLMFQGDDSLPHRSEFIMAYGGRLIHKPRT